MSRYRMRGEFWRLQYEDLHDICFDCGCYGHRALSCPCKEEEQGGREEPKGSRPEGGGSYSPEGNGKRQALVTGTGSLFIEAGGGR